jgi:hypothetical protein
MVQVKKVEDVCKGVHVGEKMEKLFQSEIYIIARA